jgi:hypothetical protein
VNLSDGVRLILLSNHQLFRRLERRDQLLARKDVDLSASVMTKRVIVLSGGLLFREHQFSLL